MNNNMNSLLNKKWQENLFQPIPVMPVFSSVHLVGIGGSGMCGIAEILLSMGYTITGSDVKKTVVTDKLEKLGAKISIGHDSSNISESVGLVVYSSAIKVSNPEINEAINKKIPVIKRGKMLSEIMRYSYGIAVAGTHGKTTTTSMITSIFIESKLNPSYIIGSEILSKGEFHGRSSNLGSSKYLIAEADESDASFLHLDPVISVITNIDKDHMETYDNDFDKLKQAYIQFANNIPFYGFLVVCGDDPNIQSILPKITSKVVTYGYEKHNDYKISNLKIEGLLTYFSVCLPDESHLDIELSVPGEHNALNALAAIAVANEEKYRVNISCGDILSALKKFIGVRRRFNVFNVKKDKNLTIINDYGHHPKEIEVTINATRAAFKNKNILMVFQPHRFSRTKDLFDDFVSTLEKVDKLIIQRIYSAGEAPIPGYHSNDLYNKLKTNSKIKPILSGDNQDSLNLIKTVAQENDVILIQGAGNIGKLKDMIIENL